MAKVCPLFWSSLVFGFTIALEASDFTLITVDKKNLKAHLSTLPAPSETSKVLKTFSIAIGKEEGDKFRQGDNKTPEGIYFPGEVIDTQKIDPGKYGQRAIPLNFPNMMDDKEGKTGYGIWLHGAGDDNRIANRQVTEGCVAFYNKDILELSRWVLPPHSLVVITEDKDQVNLKEDLVQVEERTKAWVQAWQNRDLDQYIGFYKGNFTSQGKDKKAYGQYKKRIFQSYQKMVVKMTDLRVVTHPKYAVAIMAQDFSGDRRFISKGRKILYWQKNPNSKTWVIAGEDFSPRNFVPLAFN
jgi:murein L,D-transpeptidase YafK